MNRSLMQLAWLGSRNAWGRLAAITGGVALGTVLLMLLAGAFGGLSLRQERSGWLQPRSELLSMDDGATASANLTLAPDQALVNIESDFIRGEPVNRLAMAIPPGGTFTLPEIGPPPAPGTYYASPALQALIDQASDGVLAGRYGTFAGEIPAAQLNGPESLAVVIGSTVADLQAQSWSYPVADLTGSGYSNSTTYQLVIIIGAIGLFFPLFLFVSIVTQLGAAARSERFATLRLIGAGPGLVNRLVLLETGLTAGLGVLLGIAVAWLVRPLAAMFPVAGEPFFPADLAVAPWVIGLVIVSVVGLSTAAAWWRLRQAGIGPLGGSRQQRESRPAAWRPLVLVAGTGLFLCSLLAVRLEALRDAGMVDLIPFMMIGGFLVICVGLVLIGPTLTYRASQILARRTGSAAGVIAAARIAGHPAATFRSVSGLILAVFMATVFAATVSGVAITGVAPDAPGLLPADGVYVPLRAGLATDDVTALVAAVPGVTAVVPVFATGDDSDLVTVAAADAAALGFATTPAGAWVTFDLPAFIGRDTGAGPSLAPATGSGETASPVALLVRTDGAAAGERVRTAVAAAGLTRMPAQNRAEYAGSTDSQMLTDLSLLAYLGVFAAVATAGLSLAVATASAMLDRKRVLGLLRLMGMPAEQIRRIIAFEAAVPLLAVVVLAVGMGFAVAWFLLTILANATPTLPDWRYFVTLGLSVALALGAVAATFGLVSRQTALTATRFE